MKKQFALMMILVLVLSAFVMGCSSGSVDGEGDNNGNQSEEEDLSLEKIKDAGVFIVGLDDSFAPMGFRDEAGKLVGFDIDLAKATIEKLGVEAEFKPIDWNSKELSLETGEIDCIWNGFPLPLLGKGSIIFKTIFIKQTNYYSIGRF